MNLSKIKKLIQNKNWGVNKKAGFETKSGRHYIKRKLQKALSFSYFTKNQDILEIGSGLGFFSFEYEKLGLSLTSVDISLNNITRTRERGSLLKSNADFAACDAQNLPFKENSFDGILSNSTLRYVPDLRKALRETYRVLKPGGYVLLDFPNKYCPYFGGHLKKILVERVHAIDNFYNAKELKNIFEEAGFKKMQIKRGLFVPRGISDKLLPFFVILEFIAEKIPLLIYTSAVIFVGARKN